LYRNFWNIRAITGRPSDMPSRAATPLGFIAITQVRLQPVAVGTTR
jgi:hypothetical protein